jgi:hypothetical protein
MLGFYMAVQIRPPQAGHIAVLVRAVVSQQEHCVLENLIIFIFNAEVFVRPSKVLLLKVLVSPLWIICKDNIVGLRLIYNQYSSSSQQSLCLQLNNLRMTIPGNERKPYSCTVPAAAAHKYDTFGGCKERPRYVRRVRRK